MNGEADVVEAQRMLDRILIAIDAHGRERAKIRAYVHENPAGECQLQLVRFLQARDVRSERIKEIARGYNALMKVTGGKPLNSAEPHLIPDLFERFVAAQAGRTRGAVRRDLKIIRSLMVFVYGDNLKNEIWAHASKTLLPASLALLPPSKRQQWGVISDEQVARLMAAISQWRMARYDRILFRFIVALLQENGGRWQGFTTARVEDIDYDAAGNPLLVRVGRGHGTKKRAAWQVRQAGPEIRALLAVHPAAGSSDFDAAPIAAHPSHGQGPVKRLETNLLNCWFSRAQRALKLDFVPGPRAFRRLYHTRDAVAGKPLDATRRRVGHKPGSKEHATYARHFSDPDLAGLAHRTGFGPSGGEYCACGRRVNHEDLQCPKCRRILRNATPLDLIGNRPYARADAWARTTACALQGTLPGGGRNP